jgi:creatinine amidohydrolase
MKIQFTVVTLALYFSTASNVAIAQITETFWDEAVGGVDTVFMEEMTTGEIAAAIRNGYSSVIVATGGLEQNGPYVVTGKHNYVVGVTADAIARKNGNTLVAPLIKFVPEGNIDPPSSHMHFPGTISLRQETYENLLIDICSSLRQNGFKQIFLIGDSAGNQEGMENVSNTLNESWNDDATKVFYIESYYSEDMWSFNYLKELGYKQMPDELISTRNNIHTDLHYESIMAIADPELVRAKFRFDNGGYNVHGVEIESISELVELGKKLVEYRVDITVSAMKEAMQNP